MSAFREWMNRLRFFGDSGRFDREIGTSFSFTSRRARRNCDRMVCQSEKRWIAPAGNLDQRIWCAKIRVKRGNFSGWNIWRWTYGWAGGCCGGARDFLFLRFCA